ncbi:MAG: hypothetical protein ACRC0G_16480, partial [Fusobacteriaceae bacterium]
AMKDEFTNTNVRTNKQMHPATLHETSLLIHNLYLRILKKFNQMEKIETLEISRKDFLDMLGLEKGYNPSSLKSIIVELTKGVEFKFQDKFTVNGSIFNIVEEKQNFKIAINYPYSEWMFTSKDIRLMSKAKNKQLMNTEELDYYRNVLEYKNTNKVGKAKELMLLVEEEFINLPSVYSRKLYSLLKKFEGSHLLKMLIKDFRYNLDIPENYRMCDIDKRILKQAEKDLKSIGINFNLVKNKDNPNDKREVTSLTFTWNYINDKKIEKDLSNSDNRLSSEIKEKKEIKSLSKKDETKVLKNLELQGMSIESLKIMKEKNPVMYWNTISLALKG